MEMCCLRIGCNGTIFGGSDGNQGRGEGGNGKAVRGKVMERGVRDR